jgi:lipopolysaccharide assembly protein A
MQIVRAVVWVLLLAVLLIFSVNNWNPVEVKIWEGLVVETKVPALVVIAFLLGLVPMWLLYQATKWRLHRRIGSLESSARTAASAAAAQSSSGVDRPFAPEPVSPIDPLVAAPDPRLIRRPAGDDEYGRR